MPTVCTARRGMSLSGHPGTFRSRRGWISAVWRGDRCGGPPTYWPRQDARRSPDGWTDDESCLQCGSGRAQRRENPRRSASPRSSTRRFFFFFFCLRKSAGDRLGHANWVQHPKAGMPLCLAHRRYSPLWVCLTRCAHQRLGADIEPAVVIRELTESDLQPPTRSAGNRDRFPILNVGECDVHSDG